MRDTRATAVMATAMVTSIKLKPADFAAKQVFGAVFIESGEAALAVGFSLFLIK